MLFDFLKQISVWQWLIIAAAIVLAATLLWCAAKKRMPFSRSATGKAAKKPDTISHTELPSAQKSSTECPILIGKVHEQGARDYQEDSFYVSPTETYASNGLLAVLADGMGGLVGGDKVSQTAVTAMMNHFYSVPQGDGFYQLLSLLESTNGAVNAMLGLENIGKSGSTLAAALIKGNRFYYINVGDSRICLYRDGVLYRLNRDHNFRNELALRAVNGDGTLDGAWSHPKAMGLSSFLGMGQIKYLDIPSEPVAMRDGDRFVLMCDGVYNALTDDELCACLSLSAGNAADALKSAIEKKAWTGQDNYTAIVLQYKERGA